MKTIRQELFSRVTLLTLILLAVAAVLGVAVVVLAEKYRNAGNSSPNLLSISFSTPQALEKELKGASCSTAGEPTWTSKWNKHPGSPTIDSTRHEFSIHQPFIAINPTRLTISFEMCCRVALGPTRQAEEVEGCTRLVTPPQQDKDGNVTLRFGKARSTAKELLYVIQCTCERWKTVPQGKRLMIPYKVTN